jgi:hypothetical protein
MSESQGNVIRLRRLISIGAVWPALLDEIADIQDSKDAPHVSMFFQLPYLIDLERTWYRVRGSREDPNRYAYLQARPAVLQWSSSGELLVEEAAKSTETAEQGSVFTQMIALVPLWHRREEYYPNYQRCLSDNELTNRVLVPPERSWFPDHRAITASQYEMDVTSRMTRLVLSALRYFLPNYSISSLTEAPIPKTLCGLFSMPSPGRVYFNQFPDSIVTQLVTRRAEEQPEPISASQIQSAMKIGLRELGAFEHQLFAMNRLRLQGERALALIGTLSLLEWYLNLYFPYKRDKQYSVGKLIREECLEFLTTEARKILLEASQLRNGLVHGSPPRRHSLMSAQGRPGQEIEYEGNGISTEKVWRIIRTSLDVYRQANLIRQARRQS